jgi:hypothetical protein
MRNKITIAAMAALFLVCCVAVPAAYSQGTCSLQTLAGTYAIFEKGASSILDPASNPSVFPFLTGATAPFVNVTELTFSPYGVGEGFFWIRIGALNGGLKPIPVHVTVTEMNRDCTGKLQYVVNLPNLSASIEERFFLFDEGREFRSVPMSIQGGIDTLAWTGTGHRISKSGKPVYSCGPHSAQGTYLLTAENLVAIDPHTALADALFIREEVSLTGDYKGTLYEKLGPIPVDGLPVSGKFTVNPDCSFLSTLIVTVNGTTSTIPINGVFFNEGKEYYALAIDDGIPYSFAQGKRIGP